MLQVKCLSNTRFALLWRERRLMSAVQVQDEAEGSSPDRRRRLFPFSQARRGVRSAEELQRELCIDELQVEVDDEEEEEEENEAEEEGGDDGDDDAVMPWPEWFCSLAGNEFFAQVDEEFLLDEFNLTGLAPAVPHYQHALDLILDAEPGVLSIFTYIYFVLESVLDCLRRIPNTTYLFC